MAQKVHEEKFKGSLRKSNTTPTEEDKFGKLGNIIKDTIMNETKNDIKSGSHDVRIDKKTQGNKQNYNKIKIEVCHNDAKNESNLEDFENIKAIFEYKTQKYKKKKKLYEEKIEYYENLNKQNIDRLFSLQQQKDDLQTQLQNSQDQNYQIQNQNEQTITSLKNMIDSFKKQKKDQFQQLNDQITTLKGQLQNNNQFDNEKDKQAHILQKMLETEKEMHEKEIIRVSSAHADLLTEKQKLSNQNKEANLQIQDLKKQLNDKDLSIEQEQLKNSSLQEKINKMQSQGGGDLFGQNESYQEQIIVLKDQINQLNAIADEHEALQEKHKDMSTRFEKMKNSMKMQANFSGLFSRGNSVAQSRQGFKEPSENSIPEKKQNQIITEDMFDQD